MSTARMRFTGALVIALATVPPASVPAQVWAPGNEALPNPLADQAEAGWGSALAICDFNGDDRGDLVIGAPRWDKPAPAPAVDAGLWAIFFGDPGGYAGGFVFWAEVQAIDARYGTAIACGDFDGDGRDEVAVSAPGFDVFGVDAAGVVDVWRYDSPNWNYDSGWAQGLGLPDAAEPFDQVGQTLAVGNFNGDAYDDLVIGVPGENVEGAPTQLDAGGVLIVYGSASGLASAGAQFLTEASGSIGGALANAHFGAALATGDFNGDGFSELAVGAPDRTVSGVTNAGEVVVLSGSAGGLLTSGVLRISDATVGGFLGVDDHFGAALAAGDFNFTAACFVIDCYTDLAIGIPGEGVFGDPQAGLIVEIPGSSGGLNTPAVEIHHQGSVSTTGDVEPNDHFGAKLAAAQLDDGLAPDLIVGVPDEDVGALVDAGQVHLLFGGSSGLGSRPSQTRTQFGFASGPPAAGDRFGSALAGRLLDPDLHGDLVVGLPGRNHGGPSNSGLVQIAYGALFADGFEYAATAAWSATTP